MQKIDLETVRKVCVLTNLPDMIVNNHIDFRLIQEIYAGIFIIKQIVPSVSISIMDAFFENHDLLWMDAPPFEAYGVDVHFSKDWKSVADFDIVVCHPRDQATVSKLIKNEGLPANGALIPFLYVIRDYLDEYLREDFVDKFGELFDDRLKMKLTDNQIGDLKIFKSKLRSSFTGFGLESQEKIFSTLLKSLVHKNFSSKNRKIKKILFLDDHRRKFYIGDSYVWLMNIRSNVFNLFPDALLTVNCQDNNRYKALDRIFAESWEAIGFENMNWNDINFKQYDLILYHNDLTIKFLSYVYSHHSEKFHSAYIYSLFDTHSELSRRIPAWSYNRLYEEKVVKNNPFTIIRNKKKHSELSLSDSERRWADDWLRSKGLDDNSQLAVFIINTSKEEKMLQRNVQIQLLKELVLKYRMKVLIYDDKSEDLQEEFARCLPDEVHNELVYASDLGIRGDLRLMSSPFVRLIISPCTGLMHLANGIYTCLLNRKMMLKSELPLLLVYAGNLKGVTDEYHPREWWANTLVKCIVLIRDDEGRKVVRDIFGVAKDVDEFNKVALPVKEFDCELILEYMERGMSGRDNFKLIES